MEEGGRNRYLPFQAKKLQANKSPAPVLGLLGLFGLYISDTKT